LLGLLGQRPVIATQATTWKWAWIEFLKERHPVVYSVLKKAYNRTSMQLTFRDLFRRCAYERSEHVICSSLITSLRWPLAAVEVLRGVGLPPDLWQVGHGRGTVVGGEPINVSDYVCFIGSTTTGRMVAAQCAGRLIGRSLEFGGKKPPFAATP
jgi:hypothetical protein